jgi:hypothetical protein
MTGSSSRASCPGVALNTAPPATQGAEHGTASGPEGSYRVVVDGGYVAAGYADHLTDADLTLLASVARSRGEPLPEAPRWLRGHPGELPALLGDPQVSRAVFGPGEASSGPAAQAALASPFLIFAVAVHAAATELQSMDHVPERSGPRQQVPLFDAPDLRDFLGSQERRLFLAELLASFTRVRSGVTGISSGPGAAPAVRPGGSAAARGRRPRRISELDLPRMASQLDEVPEADRPGVYRRLGDAALFLTGVFPDYVAGHALGPVNAARLLRSAQMPARSREELAAAPAIDLFEYLGAQWYRAAWALARARTARLAVVAEVADRFRQARRVLNHIADRRLFPEGNPWFPAPAP